MPPSASRITPLTQLAASEASTAGGVPAAFGLACAALASGVLVGSEGHMGGERAREAADLLERTGMQANRRDVESDHVGLLLRAAGFLLAAEVEALETRTLDSGVLRVRIAEDQWVSQSPLISMRTTPERTTRKWR